MRFDTVGLVVNPVAGLGAARNLAAARQVVSSLRPNQVVTGPGDLGADAVSDAQVIPAPDIQGRAVTQFLARQIISTGVDVLIVVGGDGTMADVAFALLETDSPCPLLGVGAGSTNVGNLIACRADAIAALENARFEIDTVDALVAGCNGQDLALAFNDVVIGTTVLGTLNGRVRDLDAAAFFAGEQQVRVPQAVGGAAAAVTKTTGGRSIPVAQGKLVGTVIVGFAHYECFFGKAIVGGVCLTDLTGQPAGCLVCAQPLVRTELTPTALAEVEPIHSSYISLNEGETIQATGIGPPAALCADGNPLKLLAPDDIANIHIHPQAVRVLRLQAEGA